MFNGRLLSMNYVGKLFPCGCVFGRIVLFLQGSLETVDMIRKLVQVMFKIQVSRQFQNETISGVL